MFQIEGSFVVAIMMIFYSQKPYKNANRKKEEKEGGKEKVKLPPNN